MTGTLWCFETACCASIILKLSELGCIQSAGDGIEEGIEGEGGSNSLGGEGADFGGEEEAKFDAGELRGDGLGGIHFGSARLTESVKQCFLSTSGSKNDTSARVMSRM